MKMNLFASLENAGGGEEPASFVEDAPLRPTGLGDVAVFIGGIKGEYAERFVELNQDHIWKPPLRDKSQGTGDKELERWRGQIDHGIDLEGPILCHSFLKLPKSRKSWRHGAETNGSRIKGERPRDMVYPLNSESGISSSAFCVDYAPGPRMRPIVRVTSEPERLSYWVWSPTRNLAENTQYKRHLKDFYDRGNRMEEKDIPGIESAGGSTQAPSSPASYEPQISHGSKERRTGLTGTIYEQCGKIISSGGYRVVFPVKIISHPRSNLIDVPEQTAMQKQYPNQFQFKPPEPELVAKRIFLRRNDCQSRQGYRESLEKEYEFGKNHPHLHINPIRDLAFVPGDDARWWIIEERQRYCLDSNMLPFLLDAKDICWQLLCGLKHIHDHGKMHRDIKPSNVLLQIVDDPAKGFSNRRVVAKYTDHGEVAFTERLVVGKVGTPFFCAPEILDGKQYNEKADMFSFGVLLLRLFTKYDPTRDREYHGTWPLSSADVQVWMRKVDRIIRDKCHSELEPILRGTLLQNPDARWCVDEGLAYMYQSQMCDQTAPVRLQLPWGTRPLASAQIRNDRKRKYEELESGDVVESDDGEFDDGESDDGESRDVAIITLAASGPLPNGSGTYIDESNDISLEDSGSTTPKLSCVAQLPATPCPEDIDEDALPPAFCTPVVDLEVTDPADRQLACKPEFHRFNTSWDWYDTVELGGPDIFLGSSEAPRTATRHRRPDNVHRYDPRHQWKPESVDRPVLELHIVDNKWGDCPRRRADRLTGINEPVPLQRLTKNLADAIPCTRSGEHPKKSGSLIPKDYATQIKPSNSEEDSEAETVIYSEPGVPPDALDDFGSEAETKISDGGEEPEAIHDTHNDHDVEAETERDAGDEEPEELAEARDETISETETEREVVDRRTKASHFGGRAAQTNAPTNNDRENAAPDNCKPIFLPELAQNGQRVL